MLSAFPENPAPSSQLSGTPELEDPTPSFGTHRHINKNRTNVFKKKIPSLCGVLFVLFKKEMKIALGSERGMKPRAFILGETESRGLSATRLAWGQYTGGFRTGQSIRYFGKRATCGNLVTI